MNTNPTDSDRGRDGGEHGADQVAVPEDALDAIRPGDPAPTPLTERDCPFRWFDHHDNPWRDSPWQCSRHLGHPGQHIATSAHTDHVAAVHPPDEPCRRPPQQ